MSGVLYTYLVSLMSSKGDSTRFVHVLTDQSVATGVLQGLLDVGGLVPDHVNHQTCPAQLTQLLIGRLHLPGEIDIDQQPIACARVTRADN